MKDELVSVVVPAYNIAPWLPKTLDSILAQEGVSLELLVVNDGSTDDTGAVLDAYAAAHPQVRPIHKENGGVTSARLRGVAEARGTWIGFIDGDDIIEPWMYARLLKNAHENQADISHCGHRVCFPDGRVQQIHGTGAFHIHDTNQGLYELLDAGMVDGSLCTKLFRRALFDGLSDWMDSTIKNNEDLLMNYYLFSRCKKSVYEDVCPYHYLMRSGSASYRQGNERSFFDPIRVRQHILANCTPEMENEARNALMRNLLFAYGRLAVETGEGYGGYRKRVRQLIMEQKPHFGLLSKRNYILANMICVAPWSFCLAYNVYVRVFQREEQH